MHHPTALRTFFLTSLVLCSLATFAQNHCWIKYEYDNAGNRIKRYWWCGDPTHTDPNGEVKMVAAKDFGMRAYPNPAKDMLQVTSVNELSDAELELLDMNGRSVLTQRVTGTTIEIDVSAFVTGVYALRIRTEHEEYSTTVTIAR